MNYFKLILISLALVINCKQTTKQAEVANILNIVSIENNPAVTFINKYVLYINNNPFKKDLINWVEKLNLTTKNFNNNLEIILQDDIDFDPIFNAQDYPDKGFKLINFNQSKNTFKLQGIDWENYTLEVKIKQVNNKWLVDKVINTTEN